MIEKKLVLIDGNSLINRAFYATPLLTTKDGLATNGVMGFVKLTLKLLNEVNPEYMAVAFDLKAPTFRHKMYDGYKATRKGMPEELAVQMPILKQVLKAMDIEIVEKEGFEADDIIGALANRFDGVHSYIVTGDRDSYQLVSQSVDVFFTKKGVSELEKLNIDNFKDIAGVTPEQIIELKAIMGDKSDNIPGVAGIGEVGAKKLILEYSSVDGIYKNLDNINGSIKEKLQNGKEMAYLSKTLATIDIHAPINTSLQDCEVHRPFSSQVKNLFTKLEFKTLINLDIYGSDNNETTPEKDVKKREIIKKQAYDFTEILALCDKYKEFSFEFEKNIYFYFDEIKTEFSLVLRETLLDNGIDLSQAIKGLKQIFENKDYKIIVYNKKAVKRRFNSLDIVFNASAEDVGALKYLVDYTGKEEDLKYVSEYYLLDFDAPASCVFSLYQIYMKKLKESDMTSLYYDVELPLIDVLFDMENEGIKIDIEMLNTFSEKYQKELSILSKEIYAKSEEEFNINSPSQLSKILFEKMNLPHGKKNKSGGYSTNADILEKLANDFEIVKLILRYRQVQKLLSTYIEGFRPLIDKNSKIHTTYNQFITSTGRLSSTNPNLQNIPIRDDEGKDLRKMFLASDSEHVLLDADYSQIELRLLAHFSNCKELIYAYNNNKDIHTLTASQVFETPVDKVDSTMRRNAKAVNFGIIYGISDFGLSEQLGISPKKAGEYIKKYFETYSDVKKYMDSNVAFAKENGYVTTLLNRKRVINEIKSSNFNVRSFGERAAMNMPLQGSSADIIKIAMLNVHNRLKKDGLKSKLILQVHDELVIDTLISEKEKVAEILKDEMENAVSLRVPLAVEVNEGKDWYDAH